MWVNQYKHVKQKSRIIKRIMKCVEERRKRNEFQKNKERYHEEKKQVGGIN